MGYLTIGDAGKFRKGAEGVFDGDKCIFIYTPPEQVDLLMNDLFNWMGDNKK